MTLGPRDRRDLERAYDLLEHPGFAARLVDMVGSPIEVGLQRLPPVVADRVQDATRKALEAALDTAIRGIDRDSARGPANLFHRAATGLSGAAGGAMGWTALAIELPVTTTLMLRSIADIARSQGEDLDHVATRLACLSVFALGGRSEADDGTETGYFAVRAVLAKQISDAASTIAARGVADAQAPALLRLMASIAGRFGIVVSEKAAAQLVPVIGAVGGATVNLVFTEHFQKVATGHFVVRRLERAYDPATIEIAYRELHARRAP